MMLLQNKGHLGFVVILEPERLLDLHKTPIACIKKGYSTFQSLNLKEFLSDYWIVTKELKLEKTDVYLKTEVLKALKEREVENKKQIKLEETKKGKQEAIKYQKLRAQKNS